MSEHLKTLTLDTFDAFIAGHERPVLVDFYADWCGPCQAIAPTLDQLSRDFDGRLEVVQVDVDAEPELADRYNVRTIPTIKLFRDGSEVETVLGAKPRLILEALIERNLA